MLIAKFLRTDLLLLSQHMKQFALSLLTACFCAFAACIPLEKDSPISPTDPALAAWKTVSNMPTLSQNIRALHVTPFEMYALSNSQFIRFDDKLNVQELRNLPTDRPLYGIPAVSDNTFARVYQNVKGDYVIEFRLARNSAVVKTMTANSLVDSLRSESFRVETPVTRMGCFSEDGTQFLLTGVVSPSNKVTAMIFDVQLDFNATNFTRIELARRVPITGLTPDGKIESIRSFNGNFFLATKEGGFRIAPNGTVYKLFPHWAKDFFGYNGKYYSTGFNNYDFQVSFDNGQVWRSAGITSDCQFVTNANNRIFSQRQRVEAYGAADSLISKVKPITYATDFKTSSPESIEYDIVYFKGRYYASNGKNLYSAQTFQAK
jgi:hypothetical protein